MADPEILYVQSRRAARMKRVQTAQHLVAAVLLFNAGYHHLDHNRAFAICEIFAAALLVGAVIVERVRHGHARTRGIAWVELAGAFLIFVEALDKIDGKHHASFYVLAFVQPLLLLMFAIFDSQIERLRYIRLDDDGLEYRVRVFWRTRVPWSAIRGFERRGNKIDLGGKTINLRDVVDRDAAAQWLMDALARRGVISASAAATSPAPPR